MWKHIFSYGNTRFWLRQDTGTMNLPLRMAECSPRISRCVSLHYRNPFAAVGVRFIAPVSTNTPKLYCVFMPLVLQFASFRHIKTIWVVLKNGHDESAPMPYVLSVAIHLRNKWILRIVRCCIFCTINKWYGVCVGVFIYVHLRCLLCE